MSQYSDHKIVLVEHARLCLEVGMTTAEYVVAVLNEYVKSGTSRDHPENLTIHQRLVRKYEQYLIQ